MDTCDPLVATQWVGFVDVDEMLGAFELLLDVVDDIRRHGTRGLALVG